MAVASIEELKSSQLEPETLEEDMLPQPFQGDGVSVKVYYDEFCIWKTKLGVVDCDDEWYVVDFLYGLKMNLMVRVLRHRAIRRVSDAFSWAKIEEILLSWEETSGHNDANEVIEDMPNPESEHSDELQEAEDVGNVENDDLVVKIEVEFGKTASPNADVKVLDELPKPAMTETAAYSINEELDVHCVLNSQIKVLDELPKPAMTETAAYMSINEELDVHCVLNSQTGSAADETLFEEAGDVDKVLESQSNRGYDKEIVSPIVDRKVFDDLPQPTSKGLNSFSIYFYLISIVEKVEFTSPKSCEYAAMCYPYDLPYEAGVSGVFTFTFDPGGNFGFYNVCWFDKLNVQLVYEWPLLGTITTLHVDSVGLTCDENEIHRSINPWIGRVSSLCEHSAIGFCGKKRSRSMMQQSGSQQSSFMGCSKIGCTFFDETSKSALVDLQENVYGNKDSLPLSHDLDFGCVVSRSNMDFGLIIKLSKFSTQCVSKKFSTSESEVIIEFGKWRSQLVVEVGCCLFDPGGAMRNEYELLILARIRADNIDVYSAKGSVIQMNANEHRLNHLSSVFFSLGSRLLFTSWGGNEEETDVPYVEKDGDLVTKYILSFECIKYFGYLCKNTLGTYTSECRTDARISATYVSNEGFLMRAVDVVRPLFNKALGTYVDGIDCQASRNAYYLIVFDHFRIFDNDSHAIFDPGGRPLSQIGYDPFQFDGRHGGNCLAINVDNELVQAKVCCARSYGDKSEMNGLSTFGLVIPELGNNNLVVKFGAAGNDKTVGQSISECFYFFFASLHDTDEMKCAEDKHILAGFVWDPGQVVSYFYILEDKDVVVRVGKGIVLMDTTFVVCGYDREAHMRCLVMIVRHT